MEVDLLTQEVPLSPVCFLHVGGAMGSFALSPKGKRLRWRVLLGGSRTSVTSVLGRERGKSSGQAGSGEPELRGEAGHNETRLCGSRFTSESCRSGLVKVSSQSPGRFLNNKID